VSCVCTGGSADFAAAASAAGSQSGKGLKAVLQGLDELWSEQEYAEELNLDKFISKLK
jgi:TATA-binding protein-associated factor